MFIRHEPALLAQRIPRSPHQMPQAGLPSHRREMLCRLNSDAFRACSQKIELRHMRYFIAVAETEGLTLAAKTKLHISQSSLSRQIRGLEEEIGAQLMMRTTRGIQPTPAGQVFLEYARSV